MPAPETTLARPHVSVIVPVLNEAPRLARTIETIDAARGSIEVIVVDGGSDDGSGSLASRLGACVVHTPIRQRAAQMNAGAAIATAPVLLFLHADTRLPPGWLQALRAELESDTSIVGGAFRRRFDSPSRFLRVTCWMAEWRGRHLGTFLGDQAMFVRASTFHALGGFAALDRCEDLDLSRRLAQVGRTTLLDGVVISSARRFARRGPLLQTLHDFAVATRFLVSTPGSDGTPAAIAPRSPTEASPLRP